MSRPTRFSEGLACNLKAGTQDRHAEILLADRNDLLPLSFAQQRLWFSAQIAGLGQAYHVQLGFRLKGDLDRAALRRALDRIIVRHEALRTTFAFLEERPVQQIAAAQDSDFCLIEHDLRQHADAEAELERLTALEANTSFSLQTGPLIRGRLIRIATNEHALLITMHHIITDGWSMGVLVDELSTLYSAYLRGEKDPLPALDIQYSDYAVWQRQWIEGRILQQQAAYWKTALAEAPALLEMPTDHPRPLQQNFSGAFAELELNERLTNGLRALSKKHRTTLYMTLLAAWAVLLARLSGHYDLVIGSPVANRGRIEIENLIGFFVNTLALRLDLSASPTVGELLRQAKRQALAAQQHQDIPFEQVVELAQPVRSMGHTPLFQVMFVWEKAATRFLKLPGLELQPLQLPSHHAVGFDLTLFLGESGSSIAGGIEYASSLFEPTTIERYLGYFRNLLEAMVSDDTQMVDRLSMLPAAERHHLLYEWNDTKAQFPRDLCVHQLFEEQVKKTPDATAVLFEDASLSYAELNRRANQLAHYLRELGVRPDDHVALVLERSVELVVAEIAVLKCGAAYVPVDPAYPDENKAFLIADCQARVVLSSHGIELPEQFVYMKVDIDQLPLSVSFDNLSLLPGGEATAYIMYTSGSTGRPKGVQVPHRAITPLVLNNGYAKLEQRDRVAFAANPAFDAATFEVWAPLLNGSCIVVISQNTLLDPGSFQQALKKYAVSILWLTVGLFNQYADPLQEQLSSLRYLIIGGDALDSATVTRVLRRNPPQHLINGYGPTETTTFATTYEIKVIDSARGIPIGRPIANTQIYILDRHGEPVPVGVAGELYIGGAGVALGYWNRPELTAEKFVKDPFSSEPGARMYRTGDLGRWLADGNIEFFGRNDFQVKIRGFRIELGEIEARLAEHPAVRQAVVLAREDTPGDKRLVAYYTTAVTDAPEPEVSHAEQLRSHLSALLPEYMVPAAYVRLDSLPLTANGKLDRKALPAPEQDAYATRGYEPPQGEIETLLAAIWAELLHLDRVGRHDNFFSLGGHSLLAITLIERMRRSGFMLDVRMLFTASTLAELAATVDAGLSAVEVPPNRISTGCKVITPEMLPLVDLREEEIERIVGCVPGGAGNVQDIYPLAPLQEGILFHHLVGGEGDPYLLIGQMSFDSRTRLDGYLDALQAVINRHDILRTAVLWEGLPEPVQVVWRRAILDVEEIELDTAAGDASEQLYARFDPAPLPHRRVPGALAAALHRL